MSRDCPGPGPKSIRKDPGPTLQSPRDGREADRRAQEGPPRVPAPRPGRGGPRADRDRGEVAPRRTGGARSGLGGHPRRRGLAERRRDRDLRPRQRRQPRPHPAAQAAPPPPRDRPSLRAAAREGADARADEALLQRRSREGRARARTRQGSTRQAARRRRPRRQAPDRTRAQGPALTDEPANEGERLGPAPAAPRSGVRRLLQLAVVDLGPLRRHRDFRLLLLARSVSFLGSMVTYVAIPYQVYRLSGSSLLVGALGLAELLPLLATAFLGGALADAVDRRRMVQLTEA